nr:PhzF family phenazine biosynthesis protein [Kibdelosporangium sp. MJ126-NF4]
MRYHHVDVFTPQPYRGNSLAVFPDATGLDSGQMAEITGELRHFESIFLTRDGGWQARVFDLVEELPFAGHPVIGAACVLHALHDQAPTAEWTIRLRARTVQVATRQRGEGWFSAMLDQGAPEFLGERSGDFASWFGLGDDHLDATLPPEVVSTGLRYLLLPVAPGALEHARISVPDLADRLGELGADFAYLLEATGMEGRHWNNDGVVEDVATGSAAGCVAAYLRRHGRLADGQTSTLHQGRFLRRPSHITIRATGDSIEVGGDVVLLGTGTLNRLP